MRRDLNRWSSDTDLKALRGVQSYRLEDEQTPLMRWLHRWASRLFYGGFLFWLGVLAGREIF